MNAGYGVAACRRAALAAVVVVLLGASIAVSPPVAAAPRQEDPSTDPSESAAAAPGMVDIDVDVATADARTVTGVLDDLAGNVADQLAQLETAQAAVDDALQTLAERDAAVAETHMRLEDLTARTDQVVAAAFVSPPADQAVDALLSDSVEDAAVKQSVVDIVADADAAVLEDLDQARNDLEDQQEEQEAAAAEADEARADAEAALTELEGAVSQQAQFVLGIRARLEDGPDPAELAANPELAAQVTTLAGAVQQVEVAQDLVEARTALQRAQQEAVARGEIVCPVDGGGLNFIDSWGFPRPGGRRHKGTDMMAASGTPTVAPTNGQVVHGENSLGGLYWYVYGTNGHTYYGAHLSAFENVGVGYVEAGTLIGYVGDSGNAAGGAPHLHFEYKPNGGASVNPYGILDRACPGH